MGTIDCTWISVLMTVGNGNLGSVCNANGDGMRIGKTTHIYWREKNESMDYSILS